MPIADNLPNGISLNQISDWYDRFIFYRHPPSRQEIVDWIKQFGAEHTSIASRVLDNVVLLSDIEIQQGYKNALSALPGWSSIEAERVGQWAFVGLGGQAESGAAMLHMFREANNLSSDRYHLASSSRSPTLSGWVCRNGRERPPR